MKDAKGHGSDAKGTHAEMINNLPAKMGRAHFEVIAKMLADSAPKNDLAHSGMNDQALTEAMAAHSAKVSAYADKLAMTNPGFNRQRFIEAASGKGGNRSRQSSRDNASQQIMRAGSRAARPPKGGNTSAAYATGTARHRVIRTHGWEK